MQKQPVIGGIDFRFACNNAVDNAVIAVSYTHLDVYKRQLLTFGKYTEADGAFTLPLTLTISHACMDGYHLSLFFNTLQYRLNCF